MHRHTQTQAHSGSHTYTCISSCNHPKDIYISKYTYTHTFICVPIYKYMHQHKRTAHSSTQKCIYTLTHAHTYTLMCVCVCVCMYMSCVSVKHYKKNTPNKPHTNVTDRCATYKYMHTAAFQRNRSPSFLRGTIYTRVSCFITLRSQLLMYLIYNKSYLHLRCKTILHLIMFTMKLVLICVKYIV